MELTDAINRRRSCRRYKDMIPEEASLCGAIDRACKGPSAGAIRGFKMTVTDKLDYHGAPVHVVISVDLEPYRRRYGGRGEQLYAIQDSAIAGAYLVLALADQGLDTCWVGAFSEGRVARIIGITNRPVAVICVGYGEWT